MWLLSLFTERGENKIDQESFKIIFMRFYPDLCFYAFRYVEDTDIAKDIVQDVLERFWIENYKLKNPESVASYLYQAVKNRALNYLKRERRKSGLTELFSILNHEKQISDEDIISELSFKNLQTDLLEAINQMPEQRRKIFKMSRFQQLKHKEIAEILQISPRTVETQIYRSLAFLQEKLRNYLNDR